MIQIATCSTTYRSTHSATQHARLWNSSRRAPIPNVTVSNMLLLYLKTDDETSISTVPWIHGGTTCSCAEGKPASGCESERERARSAWCVSPAQSARRAHHGVTRNRVLRVLDFVECIRVAAFVQIDARAASDTQVEGDVRRALDAVVIARDEAAACRAVGHRARLWVRCSAWRGHALVDCHWCRSWCCYRCRVLLLLQSLLRRPRAHSRHSRAVGRRKTHGRWHRSAHRDAGEVLAVTGGVKKRATERQALLLRLPKHAPL